MTVQFIVEYIIWDNKVFDIINTRYNHEDSSIFCFRFMVPCITYQY